MGKAKSCIVMFFDNAKDIWVEGPKFLSVKDARAYINECRGRGDWTRRYISAR